MTSRAEYRLILRQDNADRRLTEIGYEYGSVSRERYDKFINKKNNVDNEIKRLRNKKEDIEIIRNFLIKYECDINVSGLSEDIIEKKKKNIYDTENQSFADILKRPGITYDDLAEIDDESRPDLSFNERTEVEVMIKYEGYINKQINEVEKMRRLESKKLDESIDYHSIGGLRLEARQKLADIRPLTLGQASRISGVSPADINVLLIYLEKEKDN
jgi:tRNA uridine 5-carboxymethylaminomethyl modification enzyme